MAKYCNDLLTLELYNELCLFLGSEELTHKNSWFEAFIFTDDIETNLKTIYMFCMVNCNENAYIANYRKMGKPIEYKRNTNERVKISTFPPIVSHDEIGDEEELPIQPISSIRTSEKLIKPTHDVVKKKRRRKSKGKKVSLPNNVAPIIVVPHESESKIIVEDDILDDDIASLSYGTMSEGTIEDDFFMPITHYDDYDWENNDTSYNLENLFGTNLENCDDNNCYTIGAIHTIDDNSNYANDMPSHKLGDAMFDENDMFENLFAAINIFPKLGDAMFNEDDLFSPPTLNDQICYDDCMPPTYDDYCDDTYVIKSSDDYIYKTCHNYDYPFTEHYSFNVETIHSIRVSYDTPTIIDEKKF